MLSTAGISGISPLQMVSALVARNPKKWKRISEEIHSQHAELIAKTKRRLARIEQERKQYASLTAQLKHERIKQQLTLADMSLHVGMTRCDISRLENGVTTNPTLFTIQRYAKALGFRIEWQLMPIEQKKKRSKHAA